jgi:spore coat protein U-like protein
MKRIIAATLVAAALGAGNAQAAGSTSGQFNVNITLTSACTLGAVTPVAFAYTSLQGAAATATGGGFSVTCTTSLPYTFGLQAGSGAATPPGASTVSVTDDAVNLGYSLGLSAAGGTGNGSAQSFSVTGTMAASQAGTCATASCTNAAATNKTQTLIINY